MKLTLVFSLGRAMLGDRACTCGGAGMPCPICNPSDEVTAPKMPEGFQVDVKNDDWDE
jgi:hypothetical protein